MRRVNRGAVCVCIHCSAENKDNHLLVIALKASKSLVCLIWLVVEPYPFEKYEFVNWDDSDDYYQYMEKSTMFPTTNQ